MFTAEINALKGSTESTYAQFSGRMSVKGWTL